MHGGTIYLERITLPLQQECVMAGFFMNGMRRYIKKEVLRALQTLKQATDQIRKIKYSTDELKLQSIFAECQEAAISIGNIIEQYEGEGTEAVTELEQYCELLYQILINDSDNAFELENSINEVIRLVEALPEKLEVVFLPYKASMWDSLESVWMAAREDESCDAYVIPIPYYDKNPDGTFREFHYEGEKYPDYVHITRYDEYDFSKRHPDAVFIHYPYDNENIVTSVPEEFYSVNLKKNTSLLCYIPYFITMGGIGRHLCLVPACAYADKIFLESERVKAKYMEYLLEVDDESKEYFERKFEVLGSPKTDRIFNMKHYKKSKIKLPETKKIILFNSSITGLLKDSDKWLDKLQNVFRSFEQEQNVILWWRPHPLTDVTIKSMRPLLYEKYQEIVKQFIEKKIGIYDDSVDMYAAIALSDGYYGDRSSIVQLYGLTGKPILLEDISSGKEQKIISNDFESVFQKEIYAINMKTDVRIHEFLLNEKDVQLSCFISYIVNQSQDRRYIERCSKQAQCYEASMVCNHGHSGEKIYEYVKKYLDNRR